MQNVGMFTTFQTENLAQWYIELYTVDQISELETLISQVGDFLVVGGGSNMLLARREYDDRVFVRNQLKGITDIGKGWFRVKSWENLTQFVKMINDTYQVNSINGRFGLPGTVGGAVIGNAGSFGIEMWPYVRKVRYYDENFQFVETDEYSFSYRQSNLKGRKILLTEVLLEIPLTSSPDIKECKRYMDWRLAHQEYFKTCGSTFKNPSNSEHSAGWLIENTALKGYDLWGVKVSEKHANFISNYANKDPEKVLALIKEIQYKVYEKFGVMLEPEVMIIE